MRKPRLARHSLAIVFASALVIASSASGAVAGSGGASGGSCSAGFANSSVSDVSATSHNGGCGLVTIQNRYVVPGQGTVVNSAVVTAPSTAAGTLTVGPTPELVRSTHTVRILGIWYSYYVYV